MKSISFILLIIICQISLYSQCCPYMDAFVISPDTPCSTQETQLLTTVTTPNLGEYFGYEIEQNGNLFIITACYAQGFSTALQTYNEVVNFGVLTPGKYEYEYVALLSEMLDQTDCFGTAFTQNQVTGNFIVMDCGISDDLVGIATPTPVTCFGENNGSINIEALGGTPPYTYSINGSDFQNDSTFTNLEPGSYITYIKDSYETIIELQNVEIEEAEIFLLDCGPDIVLQPNETYNIMPTYSTDLGIVDVVWSPSTGLECPTCIETSVSPFIGACYNLTLTNAAGCISSDEICFTFTTNVGEVEIFDVQIFPNPTTEFLNIEFKQTINDDYELQIFDIKSNLVIRQNFSSTTKNHRINVSDLPKGLYLVQIISNSVFYTNKFVKE